MQASKLYFQRNPELWTAVGTLILALTSLIAFISPKRPEPKFNYICLINEKGEPVQKVVCVGPHGERVFPDQAGVLKIPQDWRQLSIRDVNSLNEVALIQIPSPCPDLLHFTIKSTQATPMRQLPK